MDDTPRSDIRRLLKNFGIQADEAIIAHLARNPDCPPLHLRITLTDLTDYGAAAPDAALQFATEGHIQT